MGQGEWPPHPKVGRVLLSGMDNILGKVRLVAGVDVVVLRWREVHHNVRSTPAGHSSCHWNAESGPLATMDT